MGLLGLMGGVGGRLGSAPFRGGIDWCFDGDVLFVFVELMSIAGSCSLFDVWRKI